MGVREEPRALQRRMLMRQRLRKLSDTRVCEPQIRARLGTTAHFCEVDADTAAAGQAPPSKVFFGSASTGTIEVAFSSPSPFECGTYTTVHARYGTYTIVNAKANMADIRQSMAHIRQSMPDSGLGFRVQALKTFRLFPFRSEAVPARPLVARRAFPRNAVPVPGSRV